MVNIRLGLVGLSVLASGTIALAQVANTTYGNFTKPEYSILLELLEVADLENFRRILEPGEWEAAVPNITPPKDSKMDTPDDIMYLECDEEVCTDTFLRPQCQLEVRYNGYAGTCCERSEGRKGPPGCYTAYGCFDYLPPENRTLRAPRSYLYEQSWDILLFCGFMEPYCARQMTHYGFRNLTVPTLTCVGEKPQNAARIVVATNTNSPYNPSNTDPTPHPSPKSKNDTSDDSDAIGAIVGASVGGLVFCLVCGFYLRRRMKKNRKGIFKSTEEVQLGHVSGFAAGSSATGPIPGRGPSPVDSPPTNELPNCEQAVNSAAPASPGRLAPPPALHRPAPDSWKNLARP